MKKKVFQPWLDIHSGNQNKYPKVELLVLVLIYRPVAQVTKGFESSVDRLLKYLKYVISN